MSENEPLSTEPYKGVRDFYPSEFAVREAVFGSIRRTLELYGYEEYNASPLERAELYEAKTSEEIVKEQTYTFTDRGDRRVTLRPEMTPSLARMVAGKRRELVFPLRWFSIGNRFRYERPQRGRLREFFQTDVDFLGLPAGEADLEVIGLAARVLKDLGAKEEDFIVRISSRELLTQACAAAGIAGDSIKEYMRLLDKKDKMPEGVFNAAVREITQVDPLALIAQDHPSLMQAKRDVLGTIVLLKEQGVGNAVFDPTLVRGFDYYTGITFEVFDTNPENPRAIFGGGRYDRLVALFGGDPIPAVGFAIGDVTLMDFLATHGILPDGSGRAQLYLGTFPESLEEARAFAETLRTVGIRVFMNLTQRTLSDQIREAAKRGIPYFATYGPDEVKSGNLRLKRLDTGAEESLDEQDFAAYLLRAPVR
ncbi:MAG TPA: histidine--tRNA ligase [Candidatus Paceibacterota bacterium]|jgi:histidyl-tRNA synthetase|nr:histidine--tRNA ligase [Candidatus Paceibacterota bacterium]